MNEDYLRKIKDCKSELKNISDWININKFDSNVKYLVSYSVMRSCGTIEVVFKNLIYDFLTVDSTEEAKLYLTKQIIDSSCNPSFGNIKKMIEQFDGNRANSFEKRVKEKGIKGNLTSLVNLRNDVGHGRDIYSSINEVVKYFESAVEVLEVLDNIINCNDEATINS